MLLQNGDAKFTDISRMIETVGWLYPLCVDGGSII